nr:hypothetical protein [Tanacetum cinerariifolium]
MNHLKQQYGKFKAEGSETLKQTFNRLHAILSHLKFMDVPIEQDDLNQKFLTNLAPEWLVYTIVWRNIDDLYTISLDDVYNYLKVYEPEPNGSQIKYEDISQIDDDEIEEIDIKWNLTSLSMRADRFWKKTGKKITIQGSNVGGFDKSKVEFFNCHKMGHFARECRTPRSQDRGKRENYKKDLKVEETAPKAMIAIYGKNKVWPLTVRPTIPTIGSKVLATKPTVAADKGNKGKAVKASTRWIWRPKQNSSGQDLNFNGVSVTFKKYQYIDTQGRLKICVIWSWKRNDYWINLVKGLPSKSFENDHSCVPCLMGNQHKASCMSKLVNSVSKPLHTLHMDLFGPNSVISLNHKWIFRNLITKIEDLKDLNVKIIKSDNEGEFRNKEINEFYSKKGIKREFSNARTPQQNGFPKRRNKTLIEAARTMLANAKLPVTFWAEAVNTACYVQNRVLVIKMMSSPDHPTSNLEDAFSSNFPNYLPLASSDYVPTSPGKTYSISSNSFGIVPLASSTFSLFHYDPYMKVLQAYYIEKSHILPPTIIPPSSIPKPQ